MPGRRGSSARGGNKDDTDGEIMRQVLPVSEGVVDMSCPPSSADEYLRQVRMEATTLPEVVIADNFEEIRRGETTLAGDALPTTNGRSASAPTNRGEEEDASFATFAAGLGGGGGRGGRGGNQKK